ncbi:MAG: hypothetical protein HY319_21550 [Armatimonadetes bacterium]|nr:hypothetical protein [Armatimonadota bacterium]
MSVRLAAPIPLHRMLDPDRSTAELLREFDLGPADIRTVLELAPGQFPGALPAGLAQLPEGLDYRACQQLIAPDGLLTIGRLGLVPVPFSPMVAPEPVEEYWSRAMPDYRAAARSDAHIDDLYPLARSFYRRRLAALGRDLAEPLRILDLASGTGRGAEAIEAHGRYLALDLDRVNLSVLCHRFHGHPRLTALSLPESVERLLEPTFRYRVQELIGGVPHLVLCGSAVHQLTGTLERTRVEILLREVAAWLAPGAVVVVADYYYPEELSDAQFEEAEERIRKRLRAHPQLEPGAFHFGSRTEYPTRRQVRRWLESAGLEVVENLTTAAFGGALTEFYWLVGRR